MIHYFSHLIKSFADFGIGCFFLMLGLSSTCGVVWISAKTGGMIDGAEDHLRGQEDEIDRVIRESKKKKDWEK